MAIRNDRGLYLLDFIERKGLERKVEHPKICLPGVTLCSDSIPQELKSHFSEELKMFTTPFHLLGALSQRQAWEQLITIPYSQTRTHATQATSLQKPSAYRTVVTNANGANQLVPFLFTVTAL